MTATLSQSATRQLADFIRGVIYERDTLLRAMDRDSLAQVLLSSRPESRSQRRRKICTRRDRRLAELYGLRPLPLPRTARIYFWLRPHRQASGEQFSAIMDLGRSQNWPELILKATYKVYDWHLLFLGWTAVEMTAGEHDENWQDVRDGYDLALRRFARICPGVNEQI